MPAPTPEKKPEKPLGNSAIARMAGNIASGMVQCPELRIHGYSVLVRESVKIAKAIVQEIEGTDD
jgi:hypothetical protein